MYGARPSRKASRQRSVAVGRLVAPAANTECGLEKTSRKSLSVQVKTESIRIGAERGSTAGKSSKAQACDRQSRLNREGAGHGPAGTPGRNFSAWVRKYTQQGLGKNTQSEAGAYRKTINEVISRSLLRLRDSFLKKSGPIVAVSAEGLDTSSLASFGELVRDVRGMTNSASVRQRSQAAGRMNRPVLFWKYDNRSGGASGSVGSSELLQQIGDALARPRRSIEGFALDTIAIPF